MPLNREHVRRVAQLLADVLIEAYALAAPMAHDAAMQFGSRWISARASCADSDALFGCRGLLFGCGLRLRLFELQFDGIGDVNPYSLAHSSHLDVNLMWACAPRLQRDRREFRNRWRRHRHIARTH
jgi:hypothetical protein